ncbi:RNA-binding domain-containing protein, partial [Microstroma glucosiphilum]
DADATCNIFVGRLSWNVDDEWLQSEFQEFGEITRAKVMTDRDTGKSKGFGYVEFTTPEAAKAALSAKDREVDGRPINVDLSQPRQPRDVNDARAKKFNDKRSDPSPILWAGGLAFSLTEDDLWEAFGAYGEVSRVTLPKDFETGRPKGFAYIEYSAQDSADKAIEGLAGQELGGRAVRLDYAPPRDQNG